VYFSWLFQTIEVKKQDDALENIVIKVIWQYTLQDGVYRVFELGVTELLPPDPAEFIDISGVTYETLEAWVSASLNLQSLRDGLIAKLNDQKARPTYIIPGPTPAFPPPAPPL
jgi:hypothetical protein